MTRNATQSRRWRRLLPQASLCSLVCVMVSLATGCAGWSEYRSGLKALRNEAYDTAVQRLEQAVVKAPESERYAEALTQAKAEATIYHTSEANVLRTNGNLTQAAEHLVKAQSYATAAKREHISAVLTQVRAEIMQAEKLAKEADSAAQKGEWDHAVELIREALAINRDLPRGEATARAYTKKAFELHVGIADTCRQKFQWEASLSHVRQALSYLPNHPKAAALLDRILDEQKADLLLAEGRRLATDGKHREALEVLGRALKLHDSRKEIKEAISATKRSFCEVLLAKGQDSFNEGNLLEALGLYSQSRKLLPTFGNVDKLIAQAREGLAERHTEQAEQLVEKSSYAMALMHCLMSAEYAPLTEARRRPLDQCLSHFRQRTKFRLGVASFKAASGHDDVAGRLEAQAMQHLLRIKPANVSLLDRSDLEAILAEHELSSDALQSFGTSNPPPKLPGIDAILIGRLESFTVSTQRNRVATGTSHYQDGVRMVRNPEYSEAKTAYNRALEEHNEIAKSLAGSQALGSFYDTGLAAGGRLDGLGALGYMLNKTQTSYSRQDLARAKQNLHAAQTRLATTPQQIPKPNIVKHEYPVYKITANAKLALSIRFLDTRTAGILHVEPVVGRHSLSDRYIQSDPRHNVDEDPLELPDEPFMREAAYSKAERELQRAIERGLLRHGHTFLVAAREAESRGNRRAAYENYVSYLFAYPVVNFDSDHIWAYLTGPFRAELDFVDLAAAARQHARILLSPGRLPLAVEEREGVLVATRFSTKPPEGVSLPCKLTAIEGHHVDSIAALKAVLGRFGAGDRVTATVVTNDRTRNIELVLVNLK